MYNLTLVQNLKDGSTPSAVYLFADRDAAILRYHTEMASSMSNENMLSVLVVIMTNTGSQVLSDYWVRSVAPEV